MTLGLGIADGHRHHNRRPRAHADAVDVVMGFSQTLINLNRSFNPKEFSSCPT